MMNFVSANEKTAKRLPVHNPEVFLMKAIAEIRRKKKYLQVSKEVSRYFFEYLVSRYFYQIYLRPVSRYIFRKYLVSISRYF